MGRPGEGSCKDLVDIINEIHGFTLIARDDTLSNEFDKAKDAA